MQEDIILTEGDIDKIEKLPPEHKNRMFEALSKHFQKYDDLLKTPINQPQRDDI